MTHAVAFDMDGLIFNSEDLYDEATDVILGRKGKRFSNEVKLEMMGLPGPQAIEILIRSYDLTDSPEELFHLFDVEMERLFATKLELMPGFLDLIHAIETLDLPKCVATSSPRKHAQLALGKFDLLERFQFVLTAEDVTLGKPNPEIYLTAASKLGIQVEKMAILEDSINGSKAAAASGAVTIAVPTKHGVGLDYSHADLVADTLCDPKIYELIGLH